MTQRICARCRTALSEDQADCPQCGTTYVPEAEVEEITWLPEEASDLAASSSDSGLGAEPTLLPQGDGPRPEPEPSSAESGTRALIDERYAVESELGRGGMGIVYLATDLRFSEQLDGVTRQVVVKRVLADSEDALRRFRRETAAIAGLDHENIVRVFDFGEDARGPYIVMGHLEGGSLRKRVLDSGPQSDEEFYHLARDLGRALQHVHERGILHRDIKPSNVLFTRGGLAKLADFGLVRIGEEHSDLSTAGGAMGTADYSAPEQLRGETVDERSDLFGLGATLYFAITSDSPRAIRESRLPMPWRPLLLRLLESKPEKRFTSAAEFLTALENAREGSVTPAPSGDAIICGECSAPNPRDARYCRRCGSGLLEPCPRCSADVEVSITFCPSCGLDVRSWKMSAKLLAEARRLLAESRVEEALQKAEAAEASFPGMEGASKLLNEARAGCERLGEALAFARGCDAEQRFEDSREAWERVLELANGHAEAQDALASLPERFRRRDGLVALAEVEADLENGRLGSARSGLTGAAELLGADAPELVDVRDRLHAVVLETRAIKDRLDRAVKARSLEDAEAAQRDLDELRLTPSRLHRAVRGGVAILRSRARLLEHLEQNDARAAIHLFSDLRREAAGEPEIVAELAEEIERRRETYLEGVCKSFEEAMAAGDLPKARGALESARGVLDGNDRVRALEDRLSRRVSRRRGLRVAVALLLVVGLATAGGFWALAFAERHLAERMDDARALIAAGDLDAAEDRLQLPAWTREDWIPARGELRELRERIERDRLSKQLAFEVAAEAQDGPLRSPAEFDKAVLAGLDAEMDSLASKGDLEGMRALIEKTRESVDSPAMAERGRRLQALIELFDVLDPSAGGIEELPRFSGLPVDLRRGLTALADPARELDRDLGAEALLMLFDMPRPRAWEDLLFGAWSEVVETEPLLVELRGRILAARREAARARWITRLAREFAATEPVDLVELEREIEDLDLSEESRMRAEEWRQAFSADRLQPAQIDAYHELTAELQAGAAEADALLSRLDRGLELALEEALPKSLVVNGASSTLSLLGEMEGLSIRIDGTELPRLTAGEFDIRVLRDPQEQKEVQVAAVYGPLEATVTRGLSVDRSRPGVEAVVLSENGEAVEVAVTASEAVRVLSVQWDDVGTIEASALPRACEVEHRLQRRRAVEPGILHLTVEVEDRAGNRNSEQMELRIPSRLQLDFDARLEERDWRGARELLGRIFGSVEAVPDLPPGAERRLGRLLDRVLGEVPTGFRDDDGQSSNLAERIHRAAREAEDVGVAELVRLAERTGSEALLQGASELHLWCSDVQQLQRHIPAAGLESEAVPLSKAELKQLRELSERLDLPGGLVNWWDAADRLPESALQRLVHPNQKDWELGVSAPGGLPRTLRHRTGIELRLIDRLVESNGKEPVRGVYFAKTEVSLAEWWAGGGDSDQTGSRGYPLRGQGRRAILAWCRENGLDLPRVSEWSEAAAGLDEEDLTNANLGAARSRVVKPTSPDEPDESDAGIGDMLGNLFELCHLDARQKPLYTDWSPILGGSYRLKPSSVDDLLGRIRWVPPSPGRYYEDVGFRPVLRIPGE